jgi:hypothetical protein
MVYHEIRIPYTVKYNSHLSTTNVYSKNGVKSLTYRIIQTQVRDVICLLCVIDYYPKARMVYLSLYTTVCVQNKNKKPIL